MTEVTTERLLLRPLTVAEAERVRDGRRRPEWSPGYPTDGDVEIAGLLVEAGAAGLGPLGHWQLVDRTDGSVVGGVGFSGGPEPGDVGLGYGIAAERRNEGLATEAVRAALAHARQVGGTRRVVADTDVGNVASQRVLEKAGFVVARRAGSTVHYEFLLPPAVP